MRDFLLTSCPVLLWVIAAFQLSFSVLLIRRWSKTKEMIFLLSGLVAVGLFCDSLMLSLGTVLSASPTLEMLSRLRFISHGALVPMLFPICAYALNWKKTAKTIVWALTAVVMVLGVAEAFATVMDVREIAGVVRYAAGDETPKWAKTVSSLLSYGTVVPLIAAGVWIWIKQKTPTLFLSGFLMFAFAALGPATRNFDLIFFISMGGEVMLILFLYLYGEHRVKRA